MIHPIHLLSDQYIPLPDLPEEVLRVTRYDPADGIPADAGEYDALFVRTVSPVGATTLPESPRKLQFVGSATAGIDHVDREWLKKEGLQFAWSPGCNAQAVGEYIATALVLWSLHTDTELSSVRVGIVGAGQTGEATARMLEKLQVSCRKYDPPREERDPAFSGSTLEELLECDVLTFHTPLVRGKYWPTWHWLDADKLKNRRFRLILNASRGGVIDETALLEAHLKGSVENFILDVWENEPVFRDAAAREAFLSTPHIAGYSVQAKQRASTMILESLFRFFRLPFPAGQDVFPGYPTDSPPLPFEAGMVPSDLSEMILQLNPIGEYHCRFQSLIGRDPEDKSRSFLRLRSDYPLRHEHPFYRLDPVITETWPLLKELGFRSG